MPAMPHFLLDFDGTLVNSETLYLVAEKNVFRRHNIPFNVAQHVETYEGLSLGEFARTLATEHGSSVDWEHELDIEYEKLLRHDLRAHDGVLGFISTYANRITVVSNSTRRDLTQKIEWACLPNDLLDGSVTRDDVQHGKPSSDMYLLALSKLGLQADDAIAVEDSIAGVRSSTAAGIRTLGIACGTCRFDALSATGVETFSRWSDLSARIAEGFTTDT